MDIPADFEQWKMINDEATAAGVNPDLVHRVIQQESGYNPQAKSPQGALGLMQLMPDTAKQLGVDPLDPRQNVRGGIQYLKQLSDRFGGDEKLIAAGYHSGPNAAQRALANPQGNPKTATYVANVAKDGESAMSAPPAPTDVASDFEKWRSQAAPADAPQEDAVTRFGKGVAQTLNPLPALKAVGNAVVDSVQNPSHALGHVVEAGKELVEPQLAQFSKAKQDYDLGHYSEMLGHTVAGITPLVGPAAANAGETIGKGDIAGGLGQGVGLLAPIGMSELAAHTVQPVAESVAARTTNAYLKPSAALKARNPTLPPWKAVLDENVPWKPSGIETLEDRQVGQNANYDAALQKGTLHPTLQKVDDDLAAMQQEWMHQGNAQPDIAKIQAMRDNLRNNPLYTKETFQTQLQPQQVQVPHPTAVDAQGNPLMQTQTQMVPQQVSTGRVFTPQTPAEIDQFKRMTSYQKNANQYGQQVHDATTEAEKVAAHSAKGLIEQAAPEAGTINQARAQTKVALQTLKKGLSRRDNTYQVGLMGQLATMSGEGAAFAAMEGHPIAAAAMAAPAVMNFALKSPTLARNLARGAYNASKVTLPAGAKVGATLAGAASSNSLRPVAMTEAQRLYQQYLGSQP